MLKWAVFARPPEFRKRVVGSDPRAATCRGKLQSKRSKLNMEINKELMLRSGAENLYKATTNKKLRETVALELSYVNSNLQLLKEQLAELNSSVELYQNPNRDVELPLIALGLKETKELDLRPILSAFLEEHYNVDPGDFEENVAELMDVRTAIRTPARDASGVKLLCQYYNQLYYFDRRFCVPDKSLGIFFEWYDALTGVPSCQRTVAFEKACVLFNVAALQTQIGCRQDRRQHQGLDKAIDSFLRAASSFEFISDNFTNAPSMDLSPEILGMLKQLMCAQARECLFEKSQLKLQLVFEQGQMEKTDSETIDKIKEYFHDLPDAQRILTNNRKAKNESNDLNKANELLENCLKLGQEAAHVSDVLLQVHRLISQNLVKEYVPQSWVALMQVKREHFNALAHYYVAIGLLDFPDQFGFSSQNKELLQFLHEENEESSATFAELRVPRDTDERRYLGKAHLREALLMHEEALRLNRMCRELKDKKGLQAVLIEAHERSLNKYAQVDEENDFQEVLEPPPILPATQFQLSLSPPDLSEHRVQDLFQNLGPLAVFNARHCWSGSRQVKLRKGGDEGFGFSVRGGAPVVVAGVDANSIAQMQGMRSGDYIVQVNDDDVKWSPHDEVVDLIKMSGDNLVLTLVTPLVGKKTSAGLRSPEARGAGLRSPMRLPRGARSPLSTSSADSSSNSSSIRFSDASSVHSVRQAKWTDKAANIEQEFGLIAINQ